MTFYLAFPRSRSPTGRLGPRAAGSALWAVFRSGDARRGRARAPTAGLCAGRCCSPASRLAVHEASCGPRAAARRRGAGRVAVTTAATLRDETARAGNHVAFGAATVMLVVKCPRPAMPSRASLLSARRCVALGRVSYSFYLLHWMIVAGRARRGRPRQALGAFGRQSRSSRPVSARPGRRHRAGGSPGVPISPLGLLATPHVPACATVA